MKQIKQTILITGASSGVGKAVAEALAGPDCRLLLCARSKERLETLAQEIVENVGHAEVICADLSDPQEISRLCGQLSSREEAISGLIHAAGVSNSHKAEAFELESAIQMMTLNTFAFQAISAALLPAMKESGRGHLIAIASVAGLRGYPYISTYAASKHALVGVVRSLAAELAGKGIRVNALCPGYLDTPMTASSIANIAQSTGRSEAEARKALEDLSPQKRLFTPQEVAESVRFLLSDAAGGISGQALPICGAEIV